jgi:uncharacterized protein (DUF1697 family)
MALVAFLRGINVGGHRTFRPSIVAKKLSRFDVVNVGAAGTFVVRKPESRAQFRAALMKELTFEVDIALCDGKDLIRMVAEDPFAGVPERADIVRFVSILSRSGHVPESLPVAVPPEGDWFVRIIGADNRFVFGVYRRHMKTIRYLGKIDTLFGAPATTRNWNTILSVAKLLE